MTTKNLQTGSSEFNPNKKRQFFLVKLVIFLALIFFGYVGFKYWKTQLNKGSEAESAAENSDVENEIFDLSDEYKNQQDDQNIENFSDLTASELKEKGGEFIYQTLLKNQVQINDLKDEMQKLRVEFSQYKNHQKIGKIIFAYIDFRQKFLAAKNYDQELKNFEMLSVFDENLQKKISKLANSLKHFSNQEKLIRSFSKLIPEVIAAKNNNVNSGILGKIRHSISKLVVIRRIDGKNPGDVDDILVKTEKFLREENYQEALNSVLLLDQSSHQILVKFLDDLNFAIEVQKIDQEILNYLKSVS